MVPAFLAGMIGVAVAYGILQQKVKTNTVDIKELNDWRAAVEGNPGGESAYIRRVECVSRHKHIKKSIDEIKDKCDQQTKATMGLKNFARYMLAKDNLSLDKIDDIINGE
jgi:hypothetical protein